MESDKKEENQDENKDKNKDGKYFISNLHDNQYFGKQ